MLYTLSMCNLSSIPKFSLGEKKKMMDYHDHLYIQRTWGCEVREWGQDTEKKMKPQRHSENPNKRMIQI